MRQKVLKFSTSFATVLTALLAGEAATGYSAKAETFAIRWTAFDVVPKADRLAVSAKATETSVVFFNDPKAALTIATKIQFASGEESASKVRDVPHDERARQDKPDNSKKKKLMIGCEPSFSPVTTPSMATVTGRCLAQAQETKFAGLVR
jgi:hypothetical protein